MVHDLYFQNIAVYRDFQIILQASFPKKTVRYLGGALYRDLTVVLQWLVQMKVNSLT